MSEEVNREFVELSPCQMTRRQLLTYCMLLEFPHRKVSELAQRYQMGEEAIRKSAYRHGIKHKGGYQPVVIKSNSQSIGYKAIADEIRLEASRMPPTNVFTDLAEETDLPVEIVKALVLNKVYEKQVEIHKDLMKKWGKDVVEVKPKPPRKRRKTGPRKKTKMIIEDYPHMTNRELVAKYDVSPSTINGIGKRYKLKKDPDVRKRCVR